MLPFYKELDKRMAAMRGAFIVLDSLVDIAEMGEASRLAPNKFFKVVLAGLCRKHNCTMLVLGHPSKKAMEDGSYYSGSTAYRNAVRNMLVIKDIEHSTDRLMGVLKNNYGSPDNSVRLTYIDGIFQSVESAAVQAQNDTKFMLVSAELLSLIRRGTEVARNNKGSGQGPKTIAKTVNSRQTAGGLRVDEIDVQNCMDTMESLGEIQYRGTSGHHRATWLPGETFPGEAYAAPKLHPAPWE